MRLLRDNGLAIALAILFALSIAGQAVFGWRAFLEEQHSHHLPAIGFLAYLGTGHFLSATFENWESEFLQMMVYIVLTALLIQRGSPESRDPDGPNPVDEVPDPSRAGPDAPWPVHRGGLVLRLYSHSLSIALGLLFVLSFGMHLIGSARRMSEEAMRHGEPMVSAAEALLKPEFWFESLQNWQSEFLSIAVLVLLGIVLRERGSPESKPVAEPHAKTGH